MSRIVPTQFLAEEIIQDTIDRFGDDVCLACSFGKDSMTISDLARKIKPDILHVWYNTGVEFKETKDHCREMVKKYNINLVELHPYKYNFWDCLEKYGPPQIRRSGKSKKPHNPRCCYYLKEKPMRNFLKSENYKAVLTGLTAEESFSRWKNAKHYSKGENIHEGITDCSQRYWSKTWDSFQVHPLISWTEQDVFDYHLNENIPLNPVYTRWGGIYKRCGCLPCTAYLGWEEKLSISHPPLYKLLMKKIGRPTLWEYETEPCLTVLMKDRGGE